MERGGHGHGRARQSMGANIHLWIQREISHAPFVSKDGVSPICSCGNRETSYQIHWRSQTSISLKIRHLNSCFSVVLRLSLLKKKQFRRRLYPSLPSNRPSPNVISELNASSKFLDQLRRFRWLNESGKDKKEDWGKIDEMFEMSACLVLIQWNVSGGWGRNCKEQKKVCHTGSMRGVDFCMDKANCVIWFQECMPKCALPSLYCLKSYPLQLLLSDTFSPLGQTHLLFQVQHYQGYETSRLALAPSVCL